jgi:hypothetical protein
MLARSWRAGGEICRPVPVPWYHGHCAPRRGGAPWRAIVGDKGKGTGKALKKAPKAEKSGKRGLAPHEQRKQADIAPAAKKTGK